MQITARHDTTDSLIPMTRKEASKHLARLSRVLNAGVMTRRQIRLLQARLAQ